MPKFFEIFGIKASDIEDVGLLEVKSSVCPFTGTVCDGGGNRHQTKITFTLNHELRNVFDENLKFVVPAVCSVDYGTEQWVVCPRRLMGFKNEHPTIPPINNHLQEHEKAILRAVGLKAGVEYGVWSEIYLDYSIDDTEINYHFDFIVAPLLRDIPLMTLSKDYEIGSEDIASLIKSCKVSKNFSGSSKDMIIKAAPDLSRPLILEVMTASTSGSDTSAGTNISAAFSSLILGRDYQGPGINKRQVWGRMATQLFAKSALAAEWGGKTFWIVQDQLLKNIELTTKLKVKDSDTSDKATINFISIKYSGRVKDHKPEMALDKVAKIKSGISFSGNGACSDILLPKAFPPKLWLLKSMLRRNVAAVIKL